MRKFKDIEIQRRIMKPKIDLKELAARESEQVEWKKNVADIEDLLRTVAAFANDYQNLGGGYIVCGAEESKDVHGFQQVAFPGLSASRLKEVEGKIMSGSKDKIDPPVSPLVEELVGEQEGHRVLVFIVPATGHAHSYRASGKDSSTYYVRRGRDTQEARNGVLRELLVRKQALAPWDRRLNEHASIADIDLLAFREILQQVGIWNPAVGIEDYFSEAVRLSDFVPALGGVAEFIRSIQQYIPAILLYCCLERSPPAPFQELGQRCRCIPEKTGVRRRQNGTNYLEPQCSRLERRWISSKPIRRPCSIKNLLSPTRRSTRSVRYKKR